MSDDRNSNKSMAGSTVSVLIPAYNRASALEATLNSVFRQTHPVKEVFVIDDGSVDQTAQTLEKIRTKHPSWDKRLKYIYQQNAGKSVALNNALQHVKGDWIAFNDSDDCWDAEKLEWQFRSLKKHPECNACFTNARFSHEWLGKLTEFDGEEIRCPGTTGILENHVAVALTNRSIRMQTVIVQAETMKVVGPFDPALRVAQDVDFIFRLSLHTPLCYVNLPLVEMDRTPAIEGRLTDLYGLGSLKRDHAHEIMLTKWLNLLAEHGYENLVGAARSMLRRKRSSIASHHIANKHYREARAMLRRAIKAEADIPLYAKWLLSYIAPGVLSNHYQKRGSTIKSD